VNSTPKVNNSRTFNLGFSNEIRAKWELLGDGAVNPSVLLVRSKRGLERGSYKLNDRALMIPPDKLILICHYLTEEARNEEPIAERRLFGSCIL
jgi:hypothetical protein